MFKHLPARIFLFGFVAVFFLFSLKIATVPAFSQMPSPFDLNADGLLDRADFDIFLKLYGNRDQQLDFNKDGKVNVLDYNLFRTALLKPPPVCQLKCAAGYMPDTQNCRCLPTVSPKPIPSGCYYKQVQCFKAPCYPILFCPNPSPSRPVCGNHICEINEYIIPPTSGPAESSSGVGGGDIILGSCPVDCQPENRCEMGANCGVNLYCKAVGTDSHYGICSPVSAGEEPTF